MHKSITSLRIRKSKKRSGKCSMIWIHKRRIWSFIRIWWISPQNGERSMKKIENRGSLSLSVECALKTSMLTKKRITQSIVSRKELRQMRWCPLTRNSLKYQTSLPKRCCMSRSRTSWIPLGSILLLNSIFFRHQLCLGELRLSLICSQTKNHHRSWIPKELARKVWSIPKIKFLPNLV